MKISVIIPTYKPKEYIWECLDSLKSQTFTKDNFEVILILNGCDNPWKQQILDWLSKHEDLNVRFVQTDTPGVSNARNIGLDMAVGEYITFIDDDDYVTGTYLQDMYESIDGDAVILSNNISFDDTTGDFDEEYANRKVYQKLRGSSKISLVSARSMLNGPWMKLIRKDVIGDARFNESFKNGEDSLFMYEISCNIKNIRLAPESAVYFRRFRQGSAVTTPKSRKYIISNILRLSWGMMRKFLNNPLKYNKAFTFTRVIAPWKDLALLAR